MNILGHQYRLRLDKDRDDMTNWGLMNAMRAEILIASDLNNQQIMSTVLHEIIECIKFHLLIKITHDDVERLEAGLYQVLIENGIDLSPLLKEIQ